MEKANKEKRQRKDIEDARTKTRDSSRSILRGLGDLDHGSDSGGEVRSGDPCPGRKHPNMGRLVDWGGMERARTPGREGTKGERG